MGNEPRKHHYIPQFFLKGWADENGKMWRYDRPFKDIVQRHVNASQVGFVEDLYTIPGVAPEIAQKLETNWFSQVDHRGSEARVKLLETPQSGWNIESKSAWSRFMLSLINRTPENLEKHKMAMRIYWADTPQEIQAMYETNKNPTDPCNFEDYAISVDPLIVEKFAASTIPNLSANQQTVDFINNMHWKVFDITGSKFLLLISDALLVMSNGLENPNGHIALPLSPTKLFVAVYDQAMMSAFDQMSPQQLACISNLLVVGRAKRFVVAANQEQNRFIRNRFGSDDSRNLMDMLLSKVSVQSMST
jgi:hypothetical protein